MSFRNIVNQNHGFTLLELLIVIAIIGILAAVTTSNLSGGREKAKEAAAKQQLTQLRTSIFRLLVDTSKGPAGCTYGNVANPEITLTDNRSGILERPPVGIIDVGCEWTAEDVAFWNGPYAGEIPIDPWGQSYTLDPDYVINQNCVGAVAGPTIYALVSIGLDEVWYSCDDVYLELK